MAKDTKTTENVINELSSTKVVDTLKVLKPYAIGAGAVIGIQLVVKGVKTLLSNDQSFEDVVESALEVANES